ncbi:Guanine nucleotide-binding protein subunit gamma 3, partial [Cucurbita argyrosperma subsp. sororia]
MFVEQEELKSTEGLPPASRCCKEVADHVIANSDPLIPTYKKHRRRCQFWKWLCGFPCSVNYPSGSVAAGAGSVGIVSLVQRYPDARAVVQPSHAANVVAVVHYLPAPALNALAVNANANANAH